MKQPKTSASICGFGLFAGDHAICSTDLCRWEGVVQWIDRSKRTISIRNSDRKGYWVGEIDGVTIIKQGKRGSSVLFSKKDAYDSLNTSEERLYFLYHLYGTGRPAFIKAAAYLKMTQAKAKTILLDYKRRKLL